MSQIDSILVTVTTAGTIKQVSTTDLWVESFMVEAQHTNTGKTWIGGSDLVRSTKYWAWLPVPHTNIAPSFQSKGHFTESYNLKDIYIDMDVNGEKANVTYILR